MRLIAFLQLRNEFENGNLIRCLENCKKWADDIYIYDDCSDDGSQDIYLKYTDASKIIMGEKRQFDRELFNKQKLLNLALKSNPQWIGWIDGDTILDRRLTNSCKEILDGVGRKGYGAVKLHNLNLWRHPAFYRLDNRFNDLWHVVFWKNNGNLHYTPTASLHQRQYPKGIGKIYALEYGYHLLHYGFSTKKQIVKKYLTYKSYGQSGWDLDRLIDEITSWEVLKVEKECFPLENVPQDYDCIKMPSQLTYNEYRAFNSWEEFKLTDLYKELDNE